MFFQYNRYIIILNLQIKRNNEDIQKIESVCRKYKQPVPKLMKLIYEPKIKKFNAEYTYENQTSDDVSVFDNDDAWFEEEQRRLEKMQSR